MLLQTTPNATHTQNQAKRNREARALPLTIAAAAPANAIAKNGSFASTFARGVYIIRNTSTPPQWAHTRSSLLSENSCCDMGAKYALPRARQSGDIQLVFGQRAARRLILDPENEQPAIKKRQTW